MTTAPRRSAPPTGLDMTFDAIILTGGRATRLGGADKAALLLDGETFLDRTLAAAAGARAVVVVGPPPTRPLPRGVRLTREDPPFTGPAAGLAAGLAALDHESSNADAVLVLACDMPYAARAVPALLRAVAAAFAAGRDGVIAVDDAGRRQPLLACLGARQMRAAVRALHDPAGRPARAITDALDLVAVPVAAAAGDVDTPHQARRFGVALTLREGESHGIRNSGTDQPGAMVERAVCGPRPADDGGRARDRDS